MLQCGKQSGPPNDASRPNQRYKGGTMAKLPVYKIADIPRERDLHEGRMTRWSMRTKDAQIIFAEITPQPVGTQGNHRAPHDHPHDMLLIVLKGTMRMEIDGQEYDIGPGEACDVRAYMMHRGYALGETPVSL